MSMAASHKIIGPFKVTTETEERDTLDHLFGIKNYTILDEAVSLLDNGQRMHILNLNVWDNNFHTVLFDVSTPGYTSVNGAFLPSNHPLFQASADELAQKLAINGVRPAGRQR